MGGTVLVAVSVYIDLHERTALSQTLGDLLLLAFALLGVLACARAALRPSAMARGWALLGVAALLWACAQAAYTFYGSTRDHVYPFPSVADIGYLGYAPFAIAGLLAFPRQTVRGESRLRIVLDAAVITIGLLLVSWATVLNKVLDAGGLNTVAGVVGLAYPLVDLAVCSLVLALGMRQPPGQRLVWLLLGGGLVLLTVTDSTYVSLVLDGRTALTGTALVFGWAGCFLLLSLAALAPWQDQTQARHDFTVALELIPYVPVVAAVVVVGSVEVHEHVPLLVCAGALAVLVAVRQVLIVRQNVRLTRDLERRVAGRTNELNVMGSIVTSSTDAIVGVSTTGVIVTWNPAAETLYGYRADEVLQHQPDFLSSTQLGGLTDLLARAQAGDSLASHQVDWARHDGTVIPVDMTISPILDGDIVVGISIFGQDVTERRRAAEALEAARREALESSRLKSEFLATMSHEIRTPMNGVIGLTDLLLDTPLDEVQRQYVEGVQGAGKSLLTLINDILDFSKLEAGKVDLEVAEFDPRRLVEEVGALLSPAAFGKRLELLAYCLPEVPSVLRGDATRIRQILLNLAGNAVKFTAEGEVAVRASCSPDGEAQVRLRVEISDTGIGIAEEDRGRLFESFFQADASTTRRYGGTGLGLAICRRLVEAMGGRIGLTTEVNAGSTFWFELPLELGSCPPPDASAGGPERLRGLRVLVVDDNATSRSVLTSQLASWQLQPDAVQDAKSALAELGRRALQGGAYDIAILDMCMPHTDGLQLAQAISSNPALASTAIIMLTSTSDLNAAALREVGVKEWLAKPVRSSDLHDRLLRIVTPDQVAPATPEPTPASLVSPVGWLGRVLVAEDNLLNQLVAEKVVTRLGYQVDLVTNGAEALETLARESYSAVLMDCHMPIMDGFEATRETRRREAGGKRTPIIAMTAAAMIEDRARCLAAGMDDYLPKPVEIEALGSMLAKWVGSTSPAVHPVPPEPPAAEPVGDDIGDAMPPIDHARLETLRKIGSGDFVAELVRIFVRDSARTASELRVAARERAAADLEAGAHRLRGASRTIGAGTVARLCSQLEDSADDLDGGQVSQLLDELEVEISRASTALEAFNQQIRV